MALMYLISLTSLITIILFVISPISSQDMKLINKIIELESGQEILVDDSLKVKLERTSHKHTVDGQTHGFAHLTLSKNDEVYEIRLGTPDLGNKLCFEEIAYGEKADFLKSLNLDVLINDIQNDSVRFTFV